MKPIFKFSITALSLVLAFILAFPLVSSAEFVKKVDNFIVFVDQSGSMTQADVKPGTQKFDKAFSDIKRLDHVTPELGYRSAVALFSSYKVQSLPATYVSGVLSAGISDVKPPFNYPTTIGDGLDDIEPMISKLIGSTALIMYTDGESNEGLDPVAEAKDLYSKYGEDLCIHIVSYATEPAGEKIIADIGALKSCSVVVTSESLSTDEAMTQFAEDVLYEEAPQVVHTFDLNFDFDKAEIKEEMIPVLEEAKKIFEKDTMTNFVIAGYTDATGPADYNQMLSEKRANAVKDWLVTNGVTASRLDAKGYGENQPKYDNNTEEGRKLNRRVELQLK